jgi:hypothetical protein
MNAARLNELLAKPAEMSAEDLHALENLCRDFPAFGLPYFLLARAYHERNDYRYRETLHAAALRCPNRRWLKGFMDGSLQQINGSLLGAQGDDLKKETAVLLPVEPETESVVSATDAADGVRMPETVQAEPSLSPLEQHTDESAQESETTLPQLQEVSKAPKGEETPIPLQDPEILRPVTTNQETEKRINRKPEAPSTDPTADNKPWRRKHVDPAAMTVYSIEDHYPPAEQPEEHEGVRDFFSWLRNPHKEPEEPIQQPEPKEEKDDIIKRFLETRPSVSRPKKEFFNPVNMAKKSEQEDPELVTETLANIYWKQGNHDKAIGMFEKLILKYPGKRPYFAALIQKIRQENES